MIHEAPHFKPLSNRVSPDLLGRDDVQLKRRPFLIDSTELYFPERLNPEVNPDFPKIFVLDRVGDDSSSLIRATRGLIDANLPRYGCLVIRGLPLRGNTICVDETQSDLSFSELLHQMDYKLTRYVGGVTARKESDFMVYPASDEDPQVCMDLHQDNTYWLEPPKQLFFYYEQPAEKGGLNPLLDVREYLKKIPKDIVAKFESLGVRYENYYPDQSVEFLPDFLARADAGDGYVVVNAGQCDSRRHDALDVDPAAVVEGEVIRSC